MANFCGKCGAELNERGLCPNCDKKKGKIKLILVATLCILLILIVVIIVISTHAKKENQNNNNNKEKITTSDFQQDEKHGYFADIITADTFSGGVAKVTCITENNVYKDVLIDTSGSVLYVCSDSESIEVTPTKENGIGYVYDTAKSIYKFINIKGEVVKTSVSDEFDEIVACGGGYVLVYKCESDIDNKKHLFGVIDSTGEWIQSLSDFQIQYDNINFSGSRYAGENVFDIALESEYDFHILYNASNGKAFYLKVGIGYEDYKDWVSFDKNGNDYFICKYSGSGYSARVADKLMLQNGEKQVIPEFEEYITSHDFILHSDGTWDSISEKSPLVGSYNEELSQWVDGFEQKGDRWIKTDGEYLEIYNADTDIKSTYSDYQIDQLEMSDIYFSNGYSIISIKGKDRKNYFTVIDDSGKAKFKPLLGNCNPFPFGNDSADVDTIVYKNDNEKYNIIDLNGNLLCENLNFTYISQFSEGFAVADKDTDKKCFINANGETFLDKVELPIE